MKQRKIKDALSMSSVYLYKGKCQSDIEVNFNFGIYLNLDGIRESDLPSLSKEVNN